jgi:hypothetical protein
MMRPIVKQSADSSAKQEAPSKIKWFDTVLAYHYNYTECGNAPAVKIAIREIEKPASKISRHTFRSEADAVASQQKRKCCEHKAHLDNMLPDLVQYKWSQMSIDELEAAESDIIKKLDSLREVDEESGYTRQTAQYRALEKQLSLLLEMYECLVQKRYDENLLSITTENENKDIFIQKNSVSIRSLRFLLPFQKCMSFSDKSG